MPRFVQIGVSALIAAAPLKLLNVALRLSTPSLVRRRRSRTEWKQIAWMLQETGGEAFYRSVVSQWLDPAALVNGGIEPADAFTDNLPDYRQRMMYIDAISYLPDDILVKVDRAAMGVSLETRVPLPDHRVVESVWSLQMHLKRRNGRRSGF